MVSAEDNARSALENLIFELQKERDRNEQLEREKADLAKDNRKLIEMLYSLQMKIASSQEETHPCLISEESYSIPDDIYSTATMISDRDISTISTTSTIATAFTAQSLVKVPNAMPIDRQIMKDRRRWLITVMMIIRNEFRLYFGLPFSNKWGFFIDRYMSRMIHSFADWIDYPRGNHKLFGHSAKVNAAVVSNDGRFLYTGSDDQLIVVLDMSNDTQTKHWIAHDSKVNCLAYRGGILVSGSDDTRIRVWGAHSYQLIHTLEEHTKSVYSVHVSKPGDRIVSGSLDKSLRVWSVRTGDCLRLINGHSSAVSSVHFLGDVILSGSNDKSVAIWNSDNGKRVGVVTDGISHYITDICINCDSSLVVCLYGTGFTIYRWPQMEVVRNVREAGLSGCFHPLVPYLFAVIQNSNYNRVYSVKIRDMRNGECVRSFEEHPTPVNSVCFSPNGRRLVSVSSDKFTRVWDVSDIN